MYLKYDMKPGTEYRFICEKIFRLRFLNAKTAINPGLKMRKLSQLWFSNVEPVCKPGLKMWD